MRTPIEYTIDELVPHSGAMSLLDRPLWVEGDCVAAEVEIRSGGLFEQNGQVGAWVGIEYMAQTIGVWAGLQARNAGGAPRLGFLLGTRRFSCDRSCFQVGEVLQIIAQQQYQAENGLGQFDCRIEIAGVVVATAALNVFQPQDAAAFLKEAGHG